VHVKQPTPEPEQVYLAHLEQWLAKMNLREHLHNFILSGYDDLDELIFLTKSNYPLTDKVLQSIGIEKPGYRNRILINLGNLV
jgi:hypothetical protein